MRPMSPCAAAIGAMLFLAEAAGFLVVVALGLGVVFALLSILLALYMLKSALGIDVFKNFHVGIWTWFVNLHDHMTK